MLWITVSLKVKPDLAYGGPFVKMKYELKVHRDLLSPHSIPYFMKLSFQISTGEEKEWVAIVILQGANLRYSSAWPDFKIGLRRSGVRPQEAVNILRVKMA